jgi:hypothetical protein
MPAKEAWTIELIEARSHPEPNTGCWLWMGATGSGGYGAAKGLPFGTMVHRVSWSIANGGRAIPRGMVIRHRCDQRACVNPAHLLLGTHADNMRDRDERGRNRQPRGVGHYRAILTPAIVLAIRQRHSAGESTTVIASALGLSGTVVRGVTSGRNWRHVV